MVFPVTDKPTPTTLTRIIPEVTVTTVADDQPGMAAARRVPKNVGVALLLMVIGFLVR